MGRESQKRQESPLSLLSSVRVPGSPSVPAQLSQGFHSSVDFLPFLAELVPALAGFFLPVQQPPLGSIIIPLSVGPTRGRCWRVTCPVRTPVDSPLPDHMDTLGKGY